MTTECLDECDGSMSCECQECANAMEEMIRWGHFTECPKHSDWCQCPKCITHEVLCQCNPCRKEKAEMRLFGHFVPTKEWEETKSTGEELEEKIRELY